MGATSQSGQAIEVSSAAGATSPARYYSADWQHWQDPQPPEWIDPTGLLLDRHLASDRADATALFCDEQRVSYRQLQQSVCRFAGGLQAMHDKMEDTPDTAVIHGEIENQGGTAAKGSRKVYSIYGE